MRRLIPPVFLAISLLVFALASCGGGGDTPIGTAQVSLTDAPGLEVDNVFVTVKAVWFHTSNAAGPETSGWLRYSLDAPKTVDLASLANGSLSTVLTQDLPIGNYQQIRLIFVSNEESPVNAGHTWNNEVVVDGTVYPLQIPDTHKEHANPNIRQNRGVKLIGTFRVTDGGTLRLAIDFDVGHDVVKATRGGRTLYILKPRLRYFDLDDVGSITGRLDNVAKGYNYVIKAEQPNDAGTYRVVKRYATVDNTGAFALSFLAPGNYDVLVRGRSVETVIVKNVPVSKGAATALPTDVPMTAGSEYQVNTSVSPTGAWVNFYQTLPGLGEIPYEVRYRHVNPFTGSFFDNIALSTGQVHVGTYATGGITFIARTPVEGNGGFVASADAGDGFLIRFNRLYYPSAASYGAATRVTSADNNTTLTFGSRLTPVSPPSVSGGNGVSGTMRVWSSITGGLDNVFVFVVHGGLVIDRLVMAGGRFFPSVPYAYSISGLPGGSSIASMPAAIYGVDAIGCTSTVDAVGIPRIADLRMGSDSGVDFTMMPLP